MGAGGKELAQAHGGPRNGIGARNADGVKALRAGGFGQRAFERGRRQKSRLA
jgi:hypothetical protein